MLAERVAVVGEEQHDRVVERAARGERLIDRAERLVEGEQRFVLPPPALAEALEVVRPELGQRPHPRRLVAHVPLPDRGRIVEGQPRQRARVPRPGDPRTVGGRRSEVQEERPVGRHRPDGPGRLGREQVGAVGPGAGSHGPRRAIDDQRIAAVDGLIRRVRLRDPSIPARRDERTPREGIAVEVLAHEGRRVTVLMQRRRHRLGVVQRRTLGVVEDTGRRRGAPGEQRRTRGATQGGRRERVREADPAARRIRERPMQGGHRLGDVERLGGLIVGDDQDDVRPVVAIRGGAFVGGGHPRDGERGDGEHGEARSPPGHRSSQPPSLSCRAATNPAAIDNAISSGERPPRSRPRGLRIRPSCSSPSPRARSSST